MKASYVNPFIKSVCNTFGTMCDIQVSPGKPIRCSDKPDRNDVSAIIGFSGDAAGSVVIRFSFEVAANVATAFAKTEITPQHDDFADALGELANMVAGGAKGKFDGLSIDISLPSVVIGEHHLFPVSRNSPRISIPCTTTAGKFHVDVGMVLNDRSRGNHQTVTVGAIS